MQNDHLFANSMMDQFDRAKARSRIAREWRAKHRKDGEITLYKYQMKVGNVPIGPAIKMTRLQAAERNRNLSQRYIQRLDQDPDARLMTWEMIEEEKTRMKENVRKIKL